MLISELSERDLLVLDTYVWVWASGEAGGPEQLGSAALAPIEAAARSRRLFVSAASVWEIALKAERGQALISGDLDVWVRAQRMYPGVRVLPIGSRTATGCTRLPAWTPRRDGRQHRDPADRFIVTTTRRLNGVLVTCDEEILAYAGAGHLKAYVAC
jgi:PIN domain nuclease of toxin-antitoxin system